MAKHIQTRGRFTGRHDPTGNLYSQMNNPEIKFESSSKQLTLVATEFGHMFTLIVDLDQKTGVMTPTASMALAAEGSFGKSIQLKATATLETGFLTVRCLNDNDANCWFTSKFKTKID